MMAELRWIGNWWNGMHVEPISSSTELVCRNPATGEPFARVLLSTAVDVERAVEAAQRVRVAWSQQMTSKGRAQIMYRFRALVIEHQEELARLIVQEHGKTYTEAVGEIQKANETVEWACSMPQLLQGRTLDVSTGIRCADQREPIGIVGTIVPFNFPMMVPMWTMPIALVAGNCVILKPSEKVPQTLLRIAELFKQAGLPDGVLNIVQGTADVVNAICDHPAIHAVSFVGSSLIAQHVATRCATVHQRASSKSVVSAPATAAASRSFASVPPTCLPKRALALGGAKNHLVALPDCNVEMTANDVVASFTGCAGQRCMAASVLLIVKEQPELLQQVVEKARKLTPGQQGAGVMGPVIDGAALTRITAYIEEAERQGAQVLLDGRSWSKERTNGFWIGPTVLLHENANDFALHEEVFGPVLSVLRVDSRERAVEIENRSMYGNAACIYTTVGAHADWFAQRFHAGMIGVNIGVPVPREPFSFGGWNASCFGDHDITGDGGMEFFTRRRKVTTKWMPPSTKGAGDWMS